MKAERAVVYELDAENVRKYVARFGVDARQATVEVLSGGISNSVMRIQTPVDCMVVKQSLPRLRVEAHWELERRRIFTERDCMRLLGEILPAGSVPAVRFSDERNFVLGMSCAPPGGILWKEALMRGEVHCTTAARVGGLLADVHNRSAAMTAVAAQFADQSILVAGRIDPYHRTAAKVHPELGALIAEEVDRLLSTRKTLVLGDFAPKNTIAYRDRVLILDFEVAHFGDPAFDPAFCLTHLILKAVHFDEAESRYLDAARSFWRAYRSRLAVELSHGIDWATTRELACLLLARIDGKSKVEYITERDRGSVRSLAATILLHDIPDPLLALDEVAGRIGHGRR